MANIRGERGSLVNNNRTRRAPADFGGEPAIEDLLGDPIMQALMKRDRVNLDKLNALIETAKARISRARQGD